MNIIESLKLWCRQNRCKHTNFKHISSTTTFIDDAKKIPIRRTHIRECLDCGLLYKRDSIYSYRTENTYSVFPSKQIRRLSKKEQESLKG